MESIVYDCPYCLSKYTVWDPSMGGITDRKYKEFQELVEKQRSISRCKKCKRRDEYVPTSLEMDGLKTESDMKDRLRVMVQCRECTKWTEQPSDNPKLNSCTTCETTNFDITSAMSLRTWSPSVKRKVKQNAR